MHSYTGRIATYSMIIASIVLAWNSSADAAFANDKSVAIFIYTFEELQRIGNDPAYPLNGTYALMDDIDASASTAWDDGLGFAPIGKASAPFTGSFYGMGRVISGLFINRPTQDNVGLFGYITETAFIENAFLTNASISGKNNVGALVGANWGGFVGFCNATAVVTGAWKARYVGGLIGSNAGVVDGCFSLGEVVVGEESWYVGGLIGQNYGDVVYSYSAVTVNSGDKSQYVGGLIGNKRSGNLYACYATGTVTGGRYVGGLVGYNEDDAVNASYADALIHGVTFVGGLIGRNMDRLTTSYARSDIAHAATYIGGLVGYNDGMVDACYSCGTVPNGNQSGGLIGVNSSGKIQ